MGLTFLILFSSYCLAFWVGTDFVAKGQMDGGTVMTVFCFEMWLFSNFQVFFSVMMGSMALGQVRASFPFSLLFVILFCPIDSDYSDTKGQYNL